ncbi:nitroreductase family protein [Winogradskyella ursingii]|uniref:nitroreductase family protein n=1 Tax=Winogradskyella ursingii TaxID=2686079 RepID=UPI0015CA777C|nr:nitroreductase family protein [Winogradskyella ursingii]
MEKTVSEAIAYRRSTRIYKDESIDTAKVKQCIYNASLAPTSSNLQLWEFYHITDKAILTKLSDACLDQNAAKTAKQLVVIVTRKDLWKKRTKANLDFLNRVYDKPNLSDNELKRKKMATSYYSKLIPTIYTDFLGILGYLKYIVFQIIGLFQPIYRQVRLSDMRIVAHKSAGLAAENFMISMAAIGYDTCPMEGSDTLRVKKILNLPSGAEINMVISCGIRDEKGIYGPRFRIPFEDVYFIR